MKSLLIILALILTLFNVNVLGQATKTKGIINKLIESNKLKNDSIKIRPQHSINKSTTSFGLSYLLPSSSYFFTNQAAYGFQIEGDLFSISNQFKIDFMTGYFLGNKEYYNSTLGILNNYSQSMIPVLVGPKLKINKFISFGISIGELFYSIPLLNNKIGTEFVYSPKFGFQFKRVGLNVKIISNNIFRDSNKSTLPIISLTIR